MRPPLAGKRAAALRLAGQVRRRLAPVERVLPVRLPGSEGGGKRAETPPEPAAAARAAAVPALAPEDAAARIDAARERLRATITPPEPEPEPDDPA